MRLRFFIEVETDDEITDRRLQETVLATDLNRWLKIDKQFSPRFGRLRDSEVIYIPAMLKVDRE